MKKEIFYIFTLKNTKSYYWSTYVLYET